MGGKKDKDKTGELWWVLGLLMTVQGFGSALTERIWDSSFGIPAILVRIGLPGWNDLVIGALGVAVLGYAAVRDARRKARA